MAELTEQALNQAADVVEAVSDEVVDGLRMISARAGIATAALTAMAGAFAGYLVAEKRLRAKYEQLAEDEIETMREHFRARLVARETPKPAVEDLGKKVTELGYRPPPEDLKSGPDTTWPASDPPIPDIPEDPDTPEDETDSLNIFEKSVIWDQAREEDIRDPKKPYVIHLDERHMADHEEITLTYYAGDDVLCDGKDKIIEEIDEVVGIENLDRFGHGSNDPNVVYIRNMQLAADIEVVRSERTYAEDVHGMTHSESVRERPPRWDG